MYLKFEVLNVIEQKYESLNLINQNKVSPKTVDKKCRGLKSI